MHRAVPRNFKTAVYPGWYHHKPRNEIEEDAGVEDG